MILGAACGTPATGAAGTTAIESMPGGGVSLALNAGPALVVLSLDPGTPGTNAVRVELRDPLGVAVRGAARVDLSLDGAPVATAMLGASGRPGRTTVSGSARRTTSCGDTS